ncbi:hypothetical protein AALB39_09655 [Lachnospiraceae bacterium 54-53]
MSAFLGPIHTWLYNKIKFQDAMADAVLDLSGEKEYIRDLREKTAGRYGELGKGQLEDLIETDNIHGWLQEKVSLVENRLAYAVTALVSRDPESLSSVKEAIFQLGKKNSMDQDVTAGKAYEHLENTLLNGMPCDRVNEVVRETEDGLVWQQTQDIHAASWALVQGDPKHYYALREALIKGMLDDTGIEFIQTGDQVFELRRRSCTESIS